MLRSAPQRSNACQEGIAKFLTEAVLYQADHVGRGRLDLSDRNNKIYAAYLRSAVAGTQRIFGQYLQPSPPGTGSGTDRRQGRRSLSKCGRALREANQAGFDNAIMLDPIGNVAEFATANLFMAKDGAVKTRLERHSERHYPPAYHLAA